MADEKVVSLRGGPIQRGKPVDHVVEYLEELLADAMAGKLRSIAVAWVGPNETGGGYRFENTYEDLLNLNGQLPILQLKITRHLAAQQEEKGCPA